MKLTELLTLETVIPELQAENKEDVINELIDLFKDDPRIVDIEKVRDTVMAREKILSTGVGKNFAVPHGKTDAVSDIICAFGKTPKPLDYNALDQQPVHLVFLIVGQDSLVSVHIKLLSRISRMMTKDEFREKLMRAETKEEILSLFREEEETYFDL
jgi:fructose-specific phosphotransferase system IIA component